MKEKEIELLPKNIQKAEVDVSFLLEQGAICTLNMGRWRAHEKLHPEDIGISGLDEEFVKAFFKLGRKSVIPREVQSKFEVLETQARNVFRRCALDTPFGFFVPATAFAHLDDKMKEFRKKWFEARDDLLKHLGEHQSSTQTAYREWARVVYRRIKKMVGAQSAEGYARILARRISEAIPTHRVIYNQFTFEFRSTKPIIPAVLSRRLQEKILKNKAVQEMNERITAQFKESEGLVSGFLEGIDRQIQEIVHETVSNVLDQKRIRGRSVYQLKLVIERFKLLNFSGNENIAEEIKNLETILSKGHKERGKTDIAKSLRRLRNMTNDAVIEVETQVRKRQRKVLDLSGGTEHEEKTRRVRRERMALVS